MMKRMFVLVVGMLVMSAMGAWAEGAVVQGTFTTLEGKPITGVEVMINMSPPKVAKTDEKGAFVLKDVNPGRHYISWKKAGWNFFGGEGRPIMVTTGVNAPVKVEAKLYWWAVLAQGYVGLVVMLMIATFQVLLLINYFVLPESTPSVLWFTGFFGFVILYFTFVKLEDAQKIPMLLFLVLPGMTIYYAGQDRAKKLAAVAVPKGPSKEVEIDRVHQEREQLIQSTVGKEGITVSSLCKYGKVEIDGEVFEAKAKAGFLEKGLKIRVVERDPEGLVVEEIS